MKTCPARPRRRTAGLTLLEMSLVAAVAAVVIAKVSMVLASASASIGVQTREVRVQERARVVLDRVAYQLMGAERETLTPLNTLDMHVDQVRYRVSLGVQDGQVVFSEQEAVRFDAGPAGDEVVWAERVGTPDERAVVWTRLVQPVLEGETPNGLDDNANGLTDEEGLYFVITGDHVEIGLTLATFDDEGRRAMHTATRYVKLRN